MPKAKDSYRVTGQTVPELTRELNFLLQRMADRMDRMEGIRGTASIESDLEMNANRVRDIGAGSVSTDGARLGDLEADSLDFGNVNLSGDLKVYDEDDNLIHSLE